MSSKLQNYKVKTKWCNLNLLDYTQNFSPFIFHRCATVFSICMILTYDTGNSGVVYRSDTNHIKQHKSTLEAQKEG